MLTHPTLEKLRSLRLSGMSKALEEQLNNPEAESLGFLERLGLLIDHEETSRADRRLTTRLRQAKLRMNASIEDINYQARRSLDRSVMTSLATLRWIKEHQNIIITGPTGVSCTRTPGCRLTRHPGRSNAQFKLDSVERQPASLSLQMHEMLSNSIADKT